MPLNLQFTRSILLFYFAAGSGLPYSHVTLVCYLVKLVHVIRVIGPLVSTSDCEMFWLALAQRGDFSCLCFSSGGDVVSDAAGSGGSSKKATQRGSSALAAVCSPHHILRFLPDFTGFPSPSYIKWCGLLREGTKSSSPTAERLVSVSF